MLSLPPELSGFVHSKNKGSDKIIEDFCNQKIKYCVNVDMMTVGYDMPHCDVIVLMRATESARLLQQILGRADRLYPDKPHFLVLDYAENIFRHRLAMPA